MKKLILLVVLLIPFITNAQQAKLIQKSDTTFSNPDKIFIYLKSSTEVSDFKYVASYKASPKSIVADFYTLKKYSSPKFPTSDIIDFL